MCGDGEFEGVAGEDGEFVAGLQGVGEEGEAGGACNHLVGAMLEDGEDVWVPVAPRRRMCMFLDGESLGEVEGELFRLL